MAGGTPARADDLPALVFHNHRFEPDRIEVPAQREIPAACEEHRQYRGRIRKCRPQPREAGRTGPNHHRVPRSAIPGNTNSSATSIRIPLRAYWWRNDPSCIGLAAALALLAPLAAHADYHVVSPYEIDLGELEIEHNGDAVFDRRPDHGGATSYTLGARHRPDPWWHSEIEFGFDRAPGAGQPTLLTQVVTENMFQLTEPGEYFARFRLLLRIWPVHHDAAPNCRGQ